MGALGDPFTQATPRVVKGKLGTAFGSQLTAVIDELKTRCSQPIDTSTLEFEGAVKAEAVAGGVNVTGDLAVSDDLAVTDAITAASVAVTGAATAASVTATAAVQGATVNGTTSVTTAEDGIRHGDRVLMIGAEMANGGIGPTLSTAGSEFVDTTALWGNTIGGTAIAMGCVFPIPLCVGDRIKEVVLYGRDGNGGAATDALRMTVRKRQLSDNTFSTLGGVQTSLGTGNTHLSLTVTGLTETVAATHTYQVLAASTGVPATAGEVAAYGIKVTYDHPA